MKIMMGILNIVSDMCNEEKGGHPINALLAPLGIGLFYLVGLGYASSCNGRQGLLNEKDYLLEQKQQIERTIEPYKLKILSGKENYKDSLGISLQKIDSLDGKISQIKNQIEPLTNECAYSWLYFLKNYLDK